MKESTFQILIVDDEPYNVKLLEKILQGAGHSTLSAWSGSQARALAAERSPDLILLDIMMPQEDGFETCEQLKREPKTSDIPIIFVSALDDVQTLVQGFHKGGVDYISKPFYKEEVLARVNTHLKLRHAYRRIIEEQAARLLEVKQAQDSILVHPDSLPEAGFGVCYLPVREAGGDFYDVFASGEGQWTFFISDVSGHGLGASFTTSAIKALVRQNSSRIYTPVESMQLINEVLCSIYTSGQHLTAIYLRLDRSRSRLSLVNAAHPPALHLDSRGEVHWLQASGDVLGVFKKGHLEARELHVQPGERLLLYTDGLIESFFGTKWTRLEGLKQLKLCFEQAGEKPLHEAASWIVERMLPPGIQAQDDVLALMIEI